MSQGLLLVPGDKGDEVIGVKRLFTTPLYWSLPEVFLGDKVTSYNGELITFNILVSCIFDKDARLIRFALNLHLKLFIASNLGIYYIAKEDFEDFA